MQKDTQVTRNISQSPDETFAIGRAIGEGLSGGEIVLLSGTLGAGKTVLAKGIARALGVDRWRGSPTFALMNEYRGRLALTHADLYRLGRGEARDLGLEEHVGAGRVLVVEWPERDPTLALELPADRLVEISIEPLSESERSIAVRERPT